jgi:uncharacterized membrane protein
MNRLAVSLFLVAALAGCKKQQKKAAPPPVKTMSAEEVARSTEACKVYVDKVCACATTVPAAVEQCRNAKAQPETIRIALDIAQHPESKPDIVEQTLEGVRKTVKVCIEETAKLPALGCPAQ